MPRFHHRLFTAGLSGFALLPAAAAAQVLVRGTVTDSASGKPIANVEVLASVAGRTARTDSLGRYSLDLPLGTHRILFRLIGYQPVSRTIAAFAADPLRLDLALAPAPVELAPLETTAPGASPWLQGFEDRRRLGFGRFIDDSVLRRSEHRVLPDVIRTTSPGVRFMRVGRRTVALGRGSRWCPMAIWLDGVRVYAPNSQDTSPFASPPSASRLERMHNPPPDMDQFKVAELQAVEVYSLSETPMRFQTTGSSCGTLLLWTRIK